MELGVILSEQKNFIEILHGTHHQGSIIKCSFKDKIQSARPAVSCIPAKLVSADNTGNTYITVNRFAGNRRLSDKVFCYNGFFIDLDAHEDTDDVILVKKENTVKALRKAIASGEICNYTMLTDSGRGLGLYFVLAQSIAGYGNTEKQIRFFKSIYKKLAKKIAEILCSDDTLDVDMNVLDSTRLCRLPGTYNYNSHTYCRLTEVNADAKYTLSEIANICGFVCSGKKKKAKKEYSEEAVQSFAVKRLNNLIALRDSRSDWTTMHHTLCFIYFNTAALIMPFDDAVQALEEFNAGFSDYSITNNEINSIIHSSKGGNYVYKMTNKYIVDKLNLTEDETFAFFFESKETKAKKHKDTVDKRIARDKIVCKAILTYDTYNEVVFRTGVPLRTVKRIAKKYNCGHTKGEIKDFTEINWEDAYEKEFSFSNKKSAKKGYVDVNGNTKGVTGLTFDEDGTDTFRMEGIEFDIAEEDFEPEHPIVDEEKYGYGLSFIEYLRTVLPEGKANNMKAMKTYVYEYADKDMQEKVCRALNQLAKEYSIYMSVDAAYFDIMHIAQAVTNGHFSFMKHGKKVRLFNDEKVKYPAVFIPVKTIDEIYDTLAEDMKLCAHDEEMVQAIDFTREMYTRLLRTRGWEVFRCKGRIITREAFVDRMLHCDEYTIAKIINKMMRYIHRQHHTPSFIISRIIFCKYLFA